MDRAERRDRTARYAEHARSVHVRAFHNGAACHHPLGRFAKGKSVGCRCRRRWPGHSPKIAVGYCHGAGFDYHPSVHQRIAGKRLTRAWLHELRGAEPLDVIL